MKYIIIPIFKFIIAIIISLFLIIFIPLKMLWNWDLDISSESTYHNNICIFFPKEFYDENIFSKILKFKSLLHEIWGINIKTK